MAEAGPPPSGTSSTEPASTPPGQPASSPPERRAWHRHPLVRRLPLLLVGLVGIWLWRTSGNERQIIWQLGPGHSTVREIEFQLRDDDGKLVARETRFFTEGAPAEVSQDVSLPEGTYAAEVFVKRVGNVRSEPVRTTVELEGELSVERIAPAQ